MSHFVVLALLTADQALNREMTEKSLSTLLEPFSEHLEVEPYEQPCGCIGWNAKIKGIELAKAEGHSVDELRKVFHQRPEEERTQENWLEAIKPLEDAQEAHTKAQPDYKKPDPECDECKGTGTHESTYNPKSKWDWWVIGGRWSGLFDKDYDPSNDPDNIETCFLCNGTGTRPDGVLQFGQQWADAMNGCNGCKGTGKAVKWPSNWKQFDGDIKPLAQVSNDTIPFAILTPDGKWFEKGKMGWWGMVSDEKAEEDWAKTVANVRAEYGGTIAVVVDCHI